MPYKKSFLVGLFPVFIFASFLITGSSFASGYQTVDTASALDSSFSAGYTQRAFAESFHRELDAPLELEKSLEGWQISKGFNFSTTYDSNIFLTRKNHNADMIFAYTPSVSVEHKTDIGTLGLGYDLSYVDYTDNDDLDRFNHSINTILGLNLNRSGKRLKIDFSNNFKPDTAYLTGERNELRSGEAARVITYSDNANLKVSYDLSPKTTAFYGQGFTLYYFPKSENSTKVNSLSSTTYIFNPGFSYKLTPKIGWTGEYTYELANYFEKGGNFDSGTHIWGTSLTGRITPKTNASVGVGYRVRNYQQPEITGDDDIELNVALSQKLTEKLSGTVWGTRSLGENFDIEQAASVNELKHFIGANLTWSVTPKISLDSSSSIGFAQRDNFVTFADLENGTTTALKFDTRALESQFYEASLGLNWHPRPFLAVFLGYKYYDKNSTFRQFEYSDHKTVGSLRLKF